MKNKRKYIEQQNFTEERALFFANNVSAEHCSFDIGESPFKESNGVCAKNCIIRSRYPFWYSSDIQIENCSFFDTARAGIWYTSDARFNNCVFASPKNFRRSNNIVLENITFSDDGELLWECKNVRIRNISVNGDYFAMNSENMSIENLKLAGKYSFDGVKNVEIRNSHLLTKDAFWNSENVTVYDSTVIGEYLGWNSKSLTLINCTVESLQGMCYIQNLKMINCKLVNTTLAFEYSSVEADIVGHIDSVFNPSEGRISADSIGELTVDKDLVDPTRTVITYREKAGGNA